jgi:hypothetical protein
MSHPDPLCDYSDFEDHEDFDPIMGDDEWIETDDEWLDAGFEDEEWLDDLQGEEDFA